MEENPNETEARFNETETRPNETEARLNVERALLANHANTIPMLEILRRFEPSVARPYREFEDEVFDLPVMNLSHQNAHTLSLLLVDAGALVQIMVEEDDGAKSEANGDANEEIAEEARTVTAEGSQEESREGSQTATEDNARIEATSAEQTDTDKDEQAEQIQPDEELPVDYLLKITPAGMAALDTFEPTKRYLRMLAGEPATYKEVYNVVLNACMDGAKTPDIEEALSKMPAMHEPKQVFAGHFISNLETVTGISWDDNENVWITTEGGKQMAEL